MIRRLILLVFTLLLAAACAAEPEHPAVNQNGPAAILGGKSIANTLGLSADTIPNLEQLPQGMILVQSEMNSNPKIADYNPDPPALLSRLTEWGRVIGYQDQYRVEQGCGAQTGWRWIDMQAVLHLHGEGAQNYLDWSKANNESEAGYSGQAWIDTVGDRAFKSYYTGENDCSPAEAINGVWVGFRRMNLLGFVYVEALSPAVPPAELEAMAVQLAHLMDTNFIEMGKAPPAAE